MNSILHPNQNSVAASIGADVSAAESAQDAVRVIEAKLGTDAAQERARWFVISVLRHLKREKWSEIERCGLEEIRQRGLAKDCVAIDGFMSSLRTVTKDDRSKFRLVSFGSSKNVERGRLATGTKAYKIAVYVLNEAELVELSADKPQKVKSTKSKVKPKQVEKTVVGRRAKRRGYYDDEFMNVANSTEALPNKNQTVSMTEKEFEDLDAVLSQDNAEIVQQNWEDQANEDRSSRLLGLLAGVGLFVFVALLFF